MDRRSARLRQEYLYRKSLEGKQREEYEKRRAIRQALQDGKPIPTHLRSESAALHKEVLLEDDNTAVQRNHIDDEYANVGVQDPRACPHAPICDTVVVSDPAASTGHCVMRFVCFQKSCLASKN
jgi:hypothetical protein